MNALKLFKMGQYAAEAERKAAEEEAARAATDAASIDGNAIARALGGY